MDVPKSSSSQDEEIHSKEGAFREAFLAELKSNEREEYLAPPWPETSEEINWINDHSDQSAFMIYDEKSQSYLSITELVSIDLEYYVDSILNAVLSGLAASPSWSSSDDFSKSKVLQSIRPHVYEAIRQDAVVNSSYCKKLVNWLISKYKLVNENASQSNSSDEICNAFLRQVKALKELCEEYVKFAPGPWRESVLMEAIIGHLFPLIHKYVENSISSTRHNCTSSHDRVSDSSSIMPDKNKSESTEVEDVSFSVSEGDDFSDSISSIGGGDHVSVSFNNSLASSSQGGKVGILRTKEAKSVHGKGGSRLQLNRYKAQIAMLQNQLEEAEAFDKKILQDRIRDYELDIEALRDRNSEMREQISELNLKVFELMLAGNQRKRNDPYESTSHPVHELSPGVGDNDVDEDGFQDTVPNVEEAYALKSKNKIRSKAIRDLSSSSLSMVLPDVVASEANEQINEDHRLEETLAIYKKQIDLMKNEIRYLRMTGRRSQSARPLQSSLEVDWPSPPQYASLNKTSLQVVNANESPILDKIVNQSVSFSVSEQSNSPFKALALNPEESKSDNSSRADSTSRPNSFDLQSDDGIWRVVNTLDGGMESGHSDFKPSKDSISTNKDSSSDLDQSGRDSSGSLNVASSSKPPLPPASKPPMHEDSPTHLSNFQKKHVEKMIQRGIEAGKEVDRKTIKNLCEDIEVLRSKLEQYEANEANNNTKNMERSDGIERTNATTQTLKRPTRGEASSYTHQEIYMFYSFLFGGFAVLIVSNAMEWLYNIFFSRS